MSTWGDICRRAEGEQMRKEEEAIEKERIRKQLEKERLIKQFRDKFQYEDDDISKGYYVLDYPSRIKDYGDYINPEYITWFK